MAKGGVFQAFGNLWRWTIWGLAAVLVVALWLGWSGGNGLPEDAATAAVEPEVESPAAEPEAGVAEDAATLAEETGEAMDSSADEADEADEAGEAVSGAVTAVEDTVAGPAGSVQSALEGAVRSASEAMTETEDALGDAADDARTALEREFGSEDAPSAVLEGVAPDAAAGGVVGDEEADLNILPPELSEIRIPGDDATYALESVFQRDDGSIEVTSARSQGGETVRTTRLVTCAPLSVGLIAEGDGPRNDSPELERIPLGSAAATIAAVACGAMN